jgi:hypothetical protein
LVLPYWYLCTLYRADKNIGYGGVCKRKRVGEKIRPFQRHIQNNVYVNKNFYFMYLLKRASRISSMLNIVQMGGYSWKAVRKRHDAMLRRVFLKNVPNDFKRRYQKQARPPSPPRFSFPVPRSSPRVQRQQTGEYLCRRPGLARRHPGRIHDFSRQA